LMTFTRSTVRKALGERFGIPEEDAFRTLEAQSSQNSPFERSPFVGGQSHFSAPSRINVPPFSDHQSITETLYGKPVPGEREINENAAVDPGFEQNKALAQHPIDGIRGFWQLHGRYIISQTLSGLCVIDQVLAHRRIIYERVLRSSESQLPSTQQLLFPQTLEFSASDFELLKELLPIVERMGFSVELLSGKTAILSGVPADLQTGDEKDLLHSILRQFQDISDQRLRDPRQKLAVAIAQRLSIKGGKKLSEREMEHLVDELFSCDKPYVDPLNRATITYISLEELATRFR
jgi:DNA mismatch repair protein MutL